MGPDATQALMILFGLGIISSFGTFILLYNLFDGIKPKKWKEKVKWKNLSLVTKGIFFLIPVVLPLYYFLKVLVISSKKMSLESAWTGLGASFEMFIFFVGGLALVGFILAISWITVGVISFSFRSYMVFKHGERAIKKKKRNIGSSKKNIEVLKKKED